MGIWAVEEARKRIEQARALLETNPNLLYEPAKGDRRYEEAIFRGRARTVERDLAHGSHGNSPLAELELSDVLQIIVCALSVAIMAEDWSYVAEALAMVQLAEVRVRSAGRVQ